MLRLSTNPAWPKCVALGRLMRLHAPLPILLLLTPCLMTMAVLCAAGKHCGVLLVKVIVGAILTRTFGCIINDMIDMDIDPHVERTKSRPLAAGTVSMREAAILLGALLIAGLLLLLSMRSATILVGIVLFMGIVIYPMTKRFLPLPQIFLGLAFNGGAILVATEISGGANGTVLLIYAGCVLWTIGYDTVYALQDAEHDKKLGLHSSALFFKEPVVAIRKLYNAAVASWVAAGAVALSGKFFFLLVPLAWILLRMQITDLTRMTAGTIPNAFGKLFASNVFVGLIMVLAFWLGRW